MTLSRLDTPLTASDIYPDQVKVTYRYLIGRWSLQTFASLLHAHGFRSMPGTREMRANLDLVEHDDPSNVIARRDGPTIAFTVSINVLSWLNRQETRTFGDERSTSGNNYLHPLAFDDSRPVWRLLYQRIVEHETQMYQIANDIAVAIGAGQAAGLQAMNVSHIEMSADFSTNNPHATLLALLPIFKERFRRVRFMTYENHLPTARGYAELHNDTNLVRGYRLEGVSFKLYEKTNRRDRLEAEYTRKGLNRLGAPVSLLEGDEIWTLRNFLTANCLPEMNELISQAEQNDCATHWSPNQLIARVAPFGRSQPTDLEVLLGCLSRDERITTGTLPARKLARLRRARILRRTNQGVYAIAPEYQRAFEALRLTDTLWRRALTLHTSVSDLPETAE